MNYWNEEQEQAKGKRKSYAVPKAYSEGYELWQKWQKVVKLKQPISVLGEGDLKVAIATCESLAVAENLDGPVLFSSVCKKLLELSSSQKRPITRFTRKCLSWGDQPSVVRVLSSEMKKPTRKLKVEEKDSIKWCFENPEKVWKISPKIAKIIGVPEIETNETQRTPSNLSKTVPNFNPDTLPYTNVAEQDEDWIERQMNDF